MKERKIKNIDKILNFIKENKKTAYSNIKNHFWELSESTVSRNLKKLLNLWKLDKNTKWKNTFYSFKWKETALEYLSKPFYERNYRKYNFNFLKNYIPNETSFLWKREQELLDIINTKITLSTYDYKRNIRWIENLLIDLSYSSSKLEWNTYSYLDTEILVKYNEEADWKTSLETQMILNHKNVIKYIIDFRNKLNYTFKTFSEVHILLWKWLLLKDDLGIIRNKIVKIWWSTYSPLDNKFQLEEQFNIFLEKLNQIRNPFEQSLFILIFIPYFQIFLDINKRTSRIWANIPLITNWLPPISLLQTKERDYINAILSVYELNDISLMRDLFVDNYLLNIDRYLN